MKRKLSEMDCLVYCKSMLKNTVDWSGRHEDSCGSAWPRETPQEQSDEEAPGLPAESEVPGAEINRLVEQHLNFIEGS